MSKKRGLSLEEKRTIMLQVFHETSDFFVLKDVEKFSVKLGIVSQTVKDVLQSLVDDGLVHQDKIGASNFFWAFPSEAAVKMDNDLQALTGQSNGLNQDTASLQQQIAKSKQGREDSEMKTELMDRLAKLEDSVKNTAAELDRYADSDPDKMEAMKEAVTAAKISANRWLDNLDTLQSWCRKAHSGRENELDAFFKQHGFTDALEELS